MKRLNVTRDVESRRSIAGNRKVPTVSITQPISYEQTRQEQTPDPDSKQPDGPKTRRRKTEGNA